MYTMWETNFSLDWKLFYKHLQNRNSIVSKKKHLCKHKLNICVTILFITRYLSMIYHILYDAYLKNLVETSVTRWGRFPHQKL